jgi:rhodanese-related sulfurtransferase
MFNLSILLFFLTLTLFSLSPASAAVVNISAQEAYDFLDPGNSSYNPSAFILDVRTPAEWLNPGHPGESETGAGAFLEEPDRKVFNIPFMLQINNVLTINDNFDDEVSGRFEPDDYLLVICAAGSRSTMACQELNGTGFAHIYNVYGGFSGDWLVSGLPYNYNQEGMWTPVPEPGTMLLLGSGLLGLPFCRRRKTG